MYVRTMRFALVLAAGLALALATSTAEAQWGYSPYSYYGGAPARVGVPGGHAWASAYAGSGWYGWPGRTTGWHHGSYGYYPRYYTQYYPRYYTYGGGYCYPRHYGYYRRW